MASNFITKSQNKCIDIRYYTICDSMTQGKVFLFYIEGSENLAVTNFIQPYLHQFFNDFYSLNDAKKPLRRPFGWYQSCLKAINIGQDIKQINR